MLNDVMVSSGFIEGSSILALGIATSFFFFYSAFLKLRLTLFEGFIEAGFSRPSMSRLDSFSSWA